MNSPKRPSQKKRAPSLRPLTVQLKTARGRTNSSQRWLQRQLNDPYVHQAKAEGYRSRAAFKLIEMDDKFGFLKPGARVVDLGAAPGSWLQVVSARVHRGAKKGFAVGIDLLEMDPIPDATLVQGDFLELSKRDEIKACLQGPADVVLSDMAASTTGHRGTDHLRTTALAEAAFHFAAQVLSPGGTFITKVFQGGTDQVLLELLKKHFKKIKHVKPTASRKASPEMYVVALGYENIS